MRISRLSLTAAVIAAASLSSASLKIAVFSPTRGGDFAIGSSPNISLFRSSLLTRFGDVQFVEMDSMSNPLLLTCDMAMLCAPKTTTQGINPLSVVENISMNAFLGAGGSALLFGANDTYTANADAVNESLILPFGMHMQGTEPNPAAPINVTNNSHAVTQGPFGVVYNWTAPDPGGINYKGLFGTTVANSNSTLWSQVVMVSPGAVSPAAGGGFVTADASNVLDSNSSYQFNKLVGNAVEFVGVRGKTTISMIVELQDYVGIMGMRGTARFQTGNVTFNTTPPLPTSSVLPFSTMYHGSGSLYLKFPHWLSQTISLDIQGGPQILSMSMVNGDVDGNDEIGLSDYGLLSVAYGSTITDPNWNVNADLDGNGEVGISDYGILSTNYGQTGG